MSIATFQPWCTGAVSLADYVTHFRIPECGFWGVNAAVDQGKACQTIWTLDDRVMLAYYLCEAQDEIENYIHYPLQPKWFTDETRRIKTSTLLTRWGHILAGGVMAISTIQLNASVDHTNDPAIIGPIATTVTDLSEIKIYYAGTEQEITPAKMRIVAGNLTIWIPRCRLVAPALVDNPENGWDYTDVTNFASRVDIMRVYNDPSINAKLVRAHRCNTECSTQGCTDATVDACINVRNSEIGEIIVTPGIYSSGAWSAQRGCGCYEKVKLNYMAGLTELPRPAKETIIRLAHSKMPKEPCACTSVKNSWARDMYVPDNIDPARYQSPWGISDGAWMAYLFARSIRLVRGGLVA